MKRTTPLRPGKGPQRKTGIKSKPRGRSEASQAYLDAVQFCQWTKAFTGEEIPATEVHHILGGPYGRPDGEDDDWNRFAVARGKHDVIEAHKRVATRVCIAIKGDDWDGDKAAEHGWKRRMDW